MKIYINKNAWNEVQKSAHPKCVPASCSSSTNQRVKFLNSNVNGLLQKLDNANFIQYIASSDLYVWENPSLQLHLNQTYLMTTIFILQWFKKNCHTKADIHNNLHRYSVSPIDRSACLKMKTKDTFCFNAPCMRISEINLCRVLMSCPWGQHLKQAM